LEPPLERIRECQIPELRWSAGNFIRENTRCDFVQWKHPLCKECEDVIAIRLVLQQSKQPGGRLEISGALLFDKDRVKDVQPRRLRRRVVRLFINEDEQRIAQPVNLLPRTFERAGRLRLPDAGHFDVHIEAGEIDPFGGTASWVSVTIQKVRLELMFEIGSDGLSICDTEQAWLRVLRFSDREGLGLFLKIGNGERWKWSRHGLNLHASLGEVERARRELRSRHGARPGPDVDSLFDTAPAAGYISDMASKPLSLEQHHAYMRTWRHYGLLSEQMKAEETLQMTPEEKWMSIEMVQEMAALNLNRLPPEDPDEHGMVIRQRYFMKLRRRG